MSAARGRMRRKILIYMIMSVSPVVPFAPTAGWPQSTLQFHQEPVGGGAQKLDIRETPTDVRINLQADLLFDFDKWSLRHEADAALRKAAEIIRKYPDSEVLVEGHTDGKGTEKYNQRLSERRAASVKDWLVKNGRIEPKRIVTKGWGMTKPIAANKKPDGSDNPEGRQKNRRVEIVVRKK